MIETPIVCHLSKRSSMSYTILLHYPNISKKSILDSAATPIEACASSTHWLAQVSASMLALAPFFPESTYLGRIRLSGPYVHSIFFLPLISPLGIATSAYKRHLKPIHIIVRPRGSDDLSLAGLCVCVLDDW